jgi:hypothetical protein
MGGGGGSGGGGLSLGDRIRLEEAAKRKLLEAGDGIRHVFISFAYEDLADVNLLRGQAKNERTDLEFDDYSVKAAYDSANAEYIKRKISEKIDRVSVTMVYLSPNAARSQWVNWEIEESIRRGKGVIGMYSGDAAPAAVPPAFLANRCTAVKWSHAAITDAINKSSARR